MNCLDAKIYIDDYIAGEIPENDITRFEEHVKNCPECQQMVKYERQWLKVMRSEETPEPGEKYWSGLEDRIMARTFDRDSIESSDKIEKPKKTYVTYLSYFIPVAAAILIFVLSTTDGFIRMHTPSTDIVETASIDKYEEEFESKLNINTDKKPTILGTILMSPPGSLGRHITISRLKRK